MDWKLLWIATGEVVGVALSFVVVFAAMIYFASIITPIMVLIGMAILIPLTIICTFIRIRYDKLVTEKRNSQPPSLVRR